MLRTRSRFIPASYYRFVQPFIIRLFYRFLPLEDLDKGFKFISIPHLDETLLSYFSDRLSGKDFLSRPSLSDHDLSYLSGLVLPFISDTIRRYLGLSAALDSIRLLVVNPEHCENSSGIPHHDSVGHRLKLFVPLRLDRTAITPTYYIKNSHLREWLDYSNPVRADQTRVDQFWKSSEVCTLYPYPDTVYIFDTNGVHWGSYDSLRLPRVYIVYEFSTIKSYFVRGLIGPSMPYGRKLRSILKDQRLLPAHLAFFR